MNGILTIAAREWRAQFLSPLAWTLLGALFAIGAYMFNAALLQYQTQQLQFQAFGGAERALSLTDWTVAPLLGNMAVILLLVMPLFTMRLIAEEKKNDTWPALASSPIGPLGIVLGKYLGLLFFLAAAVGLIGLMPALLYFWGNPDGGQILAGLLGLFLMGAAFGAVGLAASASTSSPMIAAIASFGLLLILWMAAWMGKSADSALGKGFAWLSLLDHYQPFLRGVVNLGDAAYFLLLAAAGLIFARQRLAAEAIRGY